MTTHDYELRLRSRRPLTPDELELVCRAALEALARLCDVPAEAPREARRGVVIIPEPGEEVRTI